MDIRIFIKQCGRDQFGNTKPPMQGHTQVIIDDYPDNGISIVVPQDDVIDYLRWPVKDVHVPDDENGHRLEKKERTKTFDKNGEMVYAKTVMEVITEIAEEIAGGRPYFIGTIDHLPPKPYYRDAFIYDDSKEEHVIKLCLNKTKHIHIRNLHIYAKNAIKKLREEIVPDKNKEEKIISALSNVENEVANCSTIDEVMQYKPEGL